MVWRPSTNERAHSSFVALTTAAVAVSIQVRDCGLKIAAQVYYLLYGVLWKALYHAGRGDGSLHSPVYSLYSREGTDLYRPLHSVVYRGRGGSLLSSVFGFL